MRTTLRIDDDVLRAARSLAATEKASLGKVISDLARRGLRPQPASDPGSGIPYFAVSEDVAPLTPGMVRDALDESA